MKVTDLETVCAKMPRTMVYVLNRLISMGLYSSRSEAIREAVMMLIERHKNELGIDLDVLQKLVSKMSGRPRSKDEEDVSEPFSWILVNNEVADGSKAEVVVKDDSVAIFTSGKMHKAVASSSELRELLRNNDCSYSYGYIECRPQNPQLFAHRIAMALQRFYHYVEVKER